MEKKEVYRENSCIALQAEKIKWQNMKIRTITKCENELMAISKTWSVEIFFFIMQELSCSTVYKDIKISLFNIALGS